MRALRRLVLVASVVLAGCGVSDRFFAPVPQTATVAIGLAPSVSATDAAALALVDGVHLTIARATGAVLVDTTLLWPSSATQMHVLLPLRLQADSERVTITVDLKQRDLVLARGATTVVAVHARSTPAVVSPQLIVTFLGITTIDAPGFVAVPFRVNANTVLAGRLLDNSGAYRGAFMWSAGRTSTVTGPNGRVAVINAVNDRQQLVGQYDAGTTFHALLWQNGAGLDLGVVAGYDASSAQDVNASGVIVGSGYHNAGAVGTVPLVWRNAQVTQLPFTGSLAGINDAGTMVGISTNATGGNQHAVVVAPSGAVSTLPDSGMQSQAVAVNAAGDAAGAILRPGSSPRAALWRAGQLVDLHVPDNGRGSQAFDLNNAGQVVGSIGFDTTNATGALARAFVWKDGSAARIDDLLTDKSWHILIGAAINDHGEIAGLGFRVDPNTGQVQPSGVLLRPAAPPSGAVASMRYSVERSGAPLLTGITPGQALKAFLLGRTGLRR